MNWDNSVETDAMLMEDFFSNAKKEPDIRKRIDLLKKIQTIYRGPVYAAFSHEHWLRQNESHYSILYLDATVLLLDELAKLNDYPCIQEYASASLHKVQGNVEIYSRLFDALKKMGAKDTAEKEWLDAQKVLSSEELAELEARLGENP